LGQLVEAFKTVSAKQINLFLSTPGSHIWQRNYYEHIVRNQVELDEIAKYIDANSEHWTDDPEYTQ
jgi:REP element-mobilizing transposase RayT